MWLCIKPFSRRTRVLETSPGDEKYLVEFFRVQTGLGFGYSEGVRVVDCRKCGRPLRDGNTSCPACGDTSLSPAAGDSSPVDAEGSLLADTFSPFAYSGTRKKPASDFHGGEEGRGVLPASPGPGGDVSLLSRLSENERFDENAFSWARSDEFPVTTASGVEGVDFWNENTAETVAPAFPETLTKQEFSEEATDSAGVSMRFLRLGEVLVAEGLINTDLLEQALAQQKAGTEHKRLGTVLIEMGVVEEDHIALALARRLGHEFVDLDSQVITASVVDSIPMNDCHRLHVVPFRADEDGTLHVAMADPTDVIGLDDLRIATGRKIIPYVALPSGVERGLSRMQGGEDVAPVRKDQTQTTERLLEVIVQDAVRRGASDIHIEPKRSGVIVRIRVDGLLSFVLRTSVDMMASLVSRIKILSDLDIAEKRVPQDGRATFEVFHKRIDARVSTLPSVFGEKVVMRLVDRSIGVVPLDKLGIPEGLLGKLRPAIRASQGLILITGPTGSGKTTTMYSVLGEIADPINNIITLEDPVEQEVIAATQVAIDEKTGLNFPRALRAVLRQDPDVVMVGEIRDAETARIALRASLTGHLVISTIHTNDTASTLTRLVDMGIEPYLIGSALSLVVAQRLVRAVCTKCAEQEEPPVTLAASYGLHLPLDGTYMHGRGCPNCGDTGMRGRLGLYEILQVTETIRALLGEGATDQQIAEAACAEGMASLWEAGVQAVAAGRTVIPEIIRALHGVQGGTHQASS